MRAKNPWAISFSQLAGQQRQRIGRQLIFHVVAGPFLLLTEMSFRRCWNSFAEEMIRGHTMFGRPQDM